MGGNCGTRRSACGLDALGVWFYGVLIVRGGWGGNQVSVDEGIPCTVIREVALLKVAGQAGNNVVK